MAFRPPWDLIHSMVGASRRARQSQRMLPWDGVLMRMALWPIANFGVVVRE